MVKIFISYKYADDQVDQRIPQKYWAEEENEMTGEVVKETKATGRAYVNFIEDLIGKNNILKGEKDGESLKGKSDERIWELLKPKVHDSTVTLVVISKGMNNIFEPESEQWVPNEIRYSLCEHDRGERVSATNALLGVIIPDCDGTYDYIYQKSHCPQCSPIPVLDKQGNPYLFNILKGNIFNRKNDDGRSCQGLYCNSTIYDGDHSYLHLVTLEEFIKDRKWQEHIDKAIEIKDKGDTEYKIQKTIYAESSK